MSLRLLYLLILKINIYYKDFLQHHPVLTDNILVCFFPISSTLCILWPFYIFVSHTVTIVTYSMFTLSQ